MDFEDLMLSEISQTEKDKYHMISLYVESKKLKKYSVYFGCVLFILYTTVQTLYNHTNVLLYLYIKPGILNVVAYLRDFQG